MRKILITMMILGCFIQYAGGIEMKNEEQIVTDCDEAVSRLKESIHNPEGVMGGYGIAEPPESKAILGAYGIAIPQKPDVKNEICYDGLSKTLIENVNTIKSRWLKGE